VTVVSGDSVEALIHGRQEHLESPVECQAGDWIYDGCISPSDEGRGVLVTAHNEVLPFSVDEKGGLVFGALISPSRPILYSAAVEFTVDGEVLVVAGTVFGEIVVWKCCLHGSTEGRAEVMFVFTGHEGSIFGVAISPVIDGGKRLLASCSDDRTVRVWDITENTSARATEKGKRIFEEARETGFGDNGNSEAATAMNQEESKRRCLAVGMGHASRIWHVKWEARPPKRAELFSFGEDATMQSWTLRADETREGWSLDKGSMVPCHNGKHIWSAAVLPAEGGRPVIATGGADGKVTLLGGNISDEETGAVRICTVDSHSLPLIPWKADCEKNISLVGPPATEGFLRYALLGEDHLLVSTTSGRLLLADLTKSLNEEGSWTEVEMSPETRDDLKSYNVARKLAPGVAILGSASGHVYLFRQSRGLEELSRFSGKITDILLIAGSESTSQQPLKVFITVLGSPEATLMTLDTNQPTVTLIQRSIPLHRGFITTSVAQVNDLLILGSRKGMITTYADSPDGYIQQTHRLDCKTKGGDAVTSITVLPPLPDARPSYVLTTCRDGKIRIYKVSRDGKTLELRHETTPPLGPMLEGARFFHPPNGVSPELIIYGFRSTNFVAWNETRQIQIASVGCGGAHRTFDYLTSSVEAAMLRLVYTKASSMNVFSQNSSSSLRVVKPGGHGREIRAVASQERSGYVATGAEDTCIRIWERPEQGVKAMRCLAVLQRHTAGIQAIRWFGEEYLLSSAGGEEFFIWRVTRLESSYKGLAVVFESRYPDRTKDGDLRITDFDVSRGDQGGMMVTLVFSDSTVKTYAYGREKGWELLCEGRWTGACLTQVRHLMMEEAGLAVLTASTDGFVAVWREGVDAEGNREYKLVLTERVHQNSVKSLDMRSDGSRWHVFTGGDDNGLGFTTIEWDAEANAFAVTSKCRVRDAHAAAITAVGIVQEEGNYTYLASVSNDQRLKIWRVEDRGSEGVKVALVENQYSALADPGGLDMIAPGKLMVGGVGMEIWSLLSS
jgi:WD40 repeat protein